MSFNVATVRKDFPIFERTVRDGKKLVYLDSGATSQKPLSVIEAESNFYKFHNAAVHRGAHQLAEEATDAYESARAKVAGFLGAKEEEIVFTKSATESLNLIAYAMGNAQPGSRFALSSSNRIVVTEMEHHANLIPWQQLAARTGAQLSWFEVTPDGRLDLSNIDAVITNDTKVVALTHQSNVLGTINPLDAIVKRAHEVGAVVVLDACQSVPHMPIDVKALGVDFVTFSGHKAVGPTGIGVLWSSVLADLPPFLFGGSMIETVTMTAATWAPAPRRFEAGVPNMAQAVGLSAAVDYLTKIGMQNLAQHEHKLTEELLDGFKEMKEVTVVGPLDMKDRGGVVSFTVDGVHPHDVGQVLDQYGIAVRTGHHCAWPLMKKLNLVGTTRASFHLYNNSEDVSSLLKAVEKVTQYFKVSK